MLKILSQLQTSKIKVVFEWVAGEHWRRKKGSRKGALVVILVK